MSWLFSGLLVGLIVGLIALASLSDEDPRK